MSKFSKAVHSIESVSLQAEKTLSAEQRIKLFEVASSVNYTGFWKLDMTNGDVVWSDEVYRIHGYEPGAITPDLSIGVKAYHPEDQAAVNEGLQRSQETGEPFEFRLRIIRPSGEIRHVYAYGICEPAVDGVVPGMYGVFMDETEERRRLIQQEELAARLALATEAGGIGVWELDLKTGRLQWDDRMYGLYGVALGTEPSFDLWQSIVHPDDVERALAEVDVAATTNTAFDTSFRIVVDGGRVRHLKANASVIFDRETGEGLRMIGTNYDVTALNRARELANEAKEREESANRLKSDFIANMSHEIRTPMNGVIMALNMAAASEPNKEVAEYLSIAQSSAKNLIRIVNDVLDISKIESGKMTIRPDAFNPHRIMDDIVRLHTPVAQEKNIKIIADLETALPKNLKGDATRIHQVVSNFVSNAVKFTQKGSVRIKASFAAETEARGMLAFHVIDSGPGIQKADQDILFERFSQLGEGTSRSDGTGLGLAISYQLAALMGGKVGIESDGVSGSDFWFTVPLDILEEPSEHTEDKQEIKETLHVLVAEDIPINQLLIRRTLENMGHTVEVANDGREALEKVKAKDSRFDLVLMDQRMPNMSGIAATEKIRKLQNACASIPIIAVTADALEEQKADFLKAGADGFVAKPVSEEDLIKEIAKVLPG